MKLCTLFPNVVRGARTLSLSAPRASFLSRSTMGVPSQCAHHGVNQMKVVLPALSFTQANLRWHSSRSHSPQADRLRSIGPGSFVLGILTGVGLASVAIQRPESENEAELNEAGTVGTATLDFQGKKEQRFSVMLDTALEVAKLALTSPVAGDAFTVRGMTHTRLQSIRPLSPSKTPYFSIEMVDDRPTYHLQSSHSVMPTDWIVDGSPSKKDIIAQLSRASRTEALDGVLRVRPVEDILHMPGYDNVTIDSNSIVVVPIRGGGSLVHFNICVCTDRLSEDKLNGFKPYQPSAQLSVQDESPQVSAITKSHPDPAVGQLPNPSPTRVGINGGGGRIGISLFGKLLYDEKFDLTQAVLSYLPNTPKMQSDLLSLYFPGFELSAVQKDNPNINCFKIKEALADTELFAQFPLDGSRLKIFDAEHKLILNTVFLKRERKPSDISWDPSLDIILESTGAFCDSEAALGHLDVAREQGTGTQVILTAPGKGGEWVTYVHGVNPGDLLKANQRRIVSAGSCTTNGLAPPLQVLNNAFGVKAAYFTTTHAITNSQNNLPKQTAKSTSSIYGPNLATTGAAQAIHSLGLEYEGKPLSIDGSALRVNIPSGSIISLTIVAKKKVTGPAEVNALLRKASETSHKGIFIVDDQLDRSDQIKGIQAVNPKMTSVSHATDESGVECSVICIHIWYDNESGYVEQVKGTARALHEKQLVNN